MTPRAIGTLKVLSLSFTVAMLAAAGKTLYGYHTHTLVLLADGIHSVFDAFATLVGIASVFAGHRPPDEGHPYGHRKFEVVASVVLALFLFGAAYEVGSLAVDRLRDPLTFPTFSMVGVYILIATVILNFAMSAIEVRANRTLGSPFLKADAAHNRSDMLVTLSALLGLISIRYQVPYVDAIVAIGITLYLVWLAFGLIVTNMRPLVDHRVLDPREVEKVVATIPQVLHCHRIRSRGEAEHHFLDLNIHLPATMSLLEAHDITHLVEERLKNAFPGLVDVVIHTEPDNHPPCSKDE